MCPITASSVFSSGPPPTDVGIVNHAVVRRETLPDPIANFWIDFNLFGGEGVDLSRYTIDASAHIMLPTEAIVCDFWLARPRNSHWLDDCGYDVEAYWSGGPNLPCHVFRL